MALRFQRLALTPRPAAFLAVVAIVAGSGVPLGTSQLPPTHSTLSLIHI